MQPKIVLSHRLPRTLCSGLHSGGMREREETTLHGMQPRISADAYPSIVVVSGHDRGGVHPLGQACMVAGRDPGCEIVRTDAGVSRRHAQFLATFGKAISVVDLASTNGTFVNGERVGARSLREGDLVRLGPDCMLRLLYLPHDVHAAPPNNIATVPLSARELQVARLVASGRTNREVAGELDIGPRTVESHLRRIYERLNLRSRAALSRWLTEQRLQ